MGKWLRSAIELICYQCGGQDFRYEKCKVICKKCGYLVENCNGD